MSLEKLFQAAVRELSKRNLLFAVAGGFAADLYRRDPRLTMDVDFVILTESRGAQAAVSVIEALGLQAGMVRKADLAGGPQFAIRRRSTEVCMVVGRSSGKTSAEGVDILLPAIPWVKDAVQRAQANAVDFGFGLVPALTLEDVIIAKLHALGAAPLRAKDLDDLQSIFAAGHKVDRPYLAGQCSGSRSPSRARLSHFYLIRYYSLPVMSADLGNGEPIVSHIRVPWTRPSTGFGPSASLARGYLPRPVLPSF